MASKFGLAGGIPERRVRPIWDAVDSRQFKAALKLSTALLSKYPNSSYALALKALILERMGKPDEALGVCLNAKEELYSSDAIHIDDLTLSTLQIVFQRLDRLDLATSCYEHACAKFPNNLDLMMGLFNCYIREYSFVKQQQTAIKMYKIVGEERFLLWAVCSIQLQVFCSNGGEKLLPLAEALLKKHIASHSLHEPEALLIYISILEQQTKYGAALEILSGNLGSLIAIEVDKLRMQGRLLARGCDYVSAAEIFQNVLELCPDDWESFLHYLGCLLEEEMSWSEGSTGDQIHLLKDLKAKNFTRFTEEVFDSRISSALSFVQKLQMEVNDDSVRCPYLANIEIEKQRRLYGKADDGRYMEALLKYFCRFCHLSCFASDVEMFLHVLNHDEKNELLEKFTEISGSCSKSPMKALGQAITIFKTQEVIGVMFRLPNGELYGNAIRMVKMFLENLTLSKDLDPQENMYGEELLSLACNVLVQLFWRTRHLGYLLEAIVVLEFGLTIRRYVWQYKILLLHLYSYLGAIPLAYEWYGTLEIKNILFETTSHHIMPEMLRSPLCSDVSDLIKEYLKFMDDYMREAADLAFLACRHRSYSKVIEFVQFKERLQHSHQYLMARIEGTILRLKENTNNIEEVECILESMNCGVQLLHMPNEEECKSLTFNEDRQSRPWWTPTSNLNYLSGPFKEVQISHKAEMFKLQSEEKVAVVREVTARRSLLPRLVYLSLQVPSYVLKENFETNGSSTFDPKCCSELKRLLERYSMSLGHPFDEAIKITLEIAEGRYSVEELGSDVIHWMSFAVFVNAWNLCSHHLCLPNGAGLASNSWNVVDGLVEKCIAEQLNSLKPILTCPGSNLPVLFQLVAESFSWHILVIQSFIRSMLPSGKKKRRSGVVDQLNSPLSEAIRSSIRLLSSAIEDVKKWLDDQINRPADENLDVLLSHLHRSDCDVGPGHVCQIIEEAASASNSDVGNRITQALQSWCSVDVVRKFIGGQCTVLSEFHLVCESKLKLLESLKLSI